MLIPEVDRQTIIDATKQTGRYRHHTDANFVINDEPIVVDEPFPNQSDNKITDEEDYGTGNPPINPELVPPPKKADEQEHNNFSQTATGDTNNSEIVIHSTHI